MALEPVYGSRPRRGGAEAPVHRNPLEERQRQAYHAREQRKAERAARGEAPRLEESTSIAEALDAEYERGARVREEELARNRRVGFRTGRQVERRAQSARPPAPTPRGGQPAAAPSSSSQRESSLKMPNIGGGLDPARGRTLILMFSTLSAIGAIARDVIHGAPTAPAFGNAPSGALTNPPPRGTVQHVKGGGVIYHPSPEERRMSQWIANHPNQLPHPNAGPNDYWNTYARNTWHNAAVSAGAVAGTAKAPVHLRSLAGVFIVGTIALVLNELNPELGVAMAGVLLLDVALGLVAPQTNAAGGTQHAVFDRVGQSLFNGGPVTVPAKGTVLA